MAAISSPPALLLGSLASLAWSGGEGALLMPRGAQGAALELRGAFELRGALELQIRSARAADWSFARVALEGPSALGWLDLPPEGALELQGLSPGRHELRIAWAEGGWLARELVLVEGERARIVIELEGGSDRVVRLGPEVQDLPEGALVRLLVRGPDGALERRTRVLGRDGSARFPDCGWDQAWVEVRAQGRCLAFERVVFVGGRALLAGARQNLELRCLDARGHPLPGVQLCLVAPEEQGEVWIEERSDAEGRARFEGVATRTLRLHAAHPVAGVRSGIELPLLRAGPTALDLVLGEGDPLLLRLVEEGQPRGKVSAVLATADGAMELASGRSDPEGRIRFEGLEPGTYRLGIRHGGLWPDAGPVELRPPGPPVDHEVRSLGHLRLWLRDSSGEPLVGVAAELWRLPGGERASELARAGRIRIEPDRSRSDPSGRIDWIGLPRGRYRLELDGGPEQLFQERLEVPGGRLRTRTLLPFGGLFGTGASGARERF